MHVYTIQGKPSHYGSFTALFFTQLPALKMFENSGRYRYRYPTDGSDSAQTVQVVLVEVLPRQIQKFDVATKVPT